MVTSDNRSTAGVVVLVAAIGAMALAIGTEIKNLDSWVYVTTPAFVGQALVHLGSVTGAYVAGQLIPTAKRLGGE